MRIVFGRGRRREVIDFPTGKNIGYTQEHVEQMCKILRVK